LIGNYRDVSDLNDDHVKTVEFFRVVSICILNMLV